MNRPLRCNSKQLICNSPQKPIQIHKLSKFQHSNSTQTQLKSNHSQSSFKPILNLKKKIQQCGIKSKITQKPLKNNSIKHISLVKQQKQILLKITEHLQKVTNDLKILLQSLKKQFINCLAITTMEIIGNCRQIITNSLNNTIISKLDDSIEFVQSVNLGLCKNDNFFQTQKQKTNNIRETGSTDQVENSLFHSVNSSFMENLCQKTSINYKSVDQIQQISPCNFKNIKILKQTIINEDQIEKQFIKLNGALHDIKIHLTVSESVEQN